MPIKRSRTDYEQQQEEDAIAQSLEQAGAVAESLQAAADDTAFWLELAERLQKNMQQNYATLPSTTQQH